MANQYLPGLTDGIMQGFQLYQAQRRMDLAERQNVEDRAFRQQQFDAQRSDSDRNFGLQQRAADRADEMSSANLGLIAEQTTRAKRENSEEYLAQEKADKDLDRAFKRQQLVDSQAKLRSEAEEQAVADAQKKFYAALFTSQLPGAQKAYQDLQSGRPTDQNAVFQYLAAPELAARVGREYTADGLAKDPKFVQSLQQAGVQIQGDNAIVPGLGQVPLSQLKFKVADVPSGRQVRDPQTGKIATLMDMDLVSDQIPNLKVQHTGPATVNGTAAGDDEIIERDPEENAKLLKGRVQEYSKIAELAQAGLNAGLTLEEVAAAAMHDPELRKQIFPDAKQKAADAKEKASAQKAKIGAIAAVNEADEIISMVDELLVAPGRQSATGLSSMIPSRPGSESTDYENKLDTLKARGQLKSLLDLKANGGTLGAVSDAEGKLLANAFGNLQLNSSEGAHKKALEDIKAKAEQSRASILGAYSDQYGEDLPVTQKNVNTSNTPNIISIKRIN